MNIVYITLTDFYYIDTYFTKNDTIEVIYTETSLNYDYIVFEKDNKLFLTKSYLKLNNVKIYGYVKKIILRNL